MDVNEFARITAIGLGRALLYLQAESAGLYHEALLHACLHNQVYDRQCKPERASYLCDLIHASGDPDLYRDQLVWALSEVQDKATDRSPDRPCARRHGAKGRQLGPLGSL